MNCYNAGYTGTIIPPEINTSLIDFCQSSVGHNEFRKAKMGAEKMVDWSSLLEIRKQARMDHKVVVWTNGCFDMLHSGHIHCLKAAKEHGDLLVVGINSDEGVRQLKGVDRPIVPISERVASVSALESVDFVIVFAELTPESAIERLKPDVCCKGSDYAPPNGKPLPEARIVEQYGGRLEFVSLVPSMSTTKIVQRIRKTQNS